jgi:hypothetical protein
MIVIPINESQISVDIIVKNFIEELKRSGYIVTHKIVGEEDTVIQARRVKNSYSFKLYVKITYEDKLIETNVFCLTPIPANKIVFCLKLLNYCAVFEERTKYNLCPREHLIMCRTYFSRNTINIPLGKALVNDLDCSVDALELMHLAIKNNDLGYMLYKMNPVRFHNYYFR